MVISDNQALETRIQTEIKQAEKARLAGNEGRARVCARRAAGIAAGEYVQQRGLPSPGQSAYDQLRYLQSLPDLPRQVQVVTSHFLDRVTTDHILSSGADLIAEARWLVEELLGWKPNSSPNSKY